MEVNLRGASPVGRDDGGRSYAAQADGKGEKRIGDVVDAVKLRCGRIPAGTGLVQESDRG